MSTNAKIRFKQSIAQRMRPAIDIAFLTSGFVVDPELNKNINIMLLKKISTRLGCMKQGMSCTCTVLSMVKTSAGLLGCHR